MAIHHIVPKSRGGSDDDWNLEELSEYDHAYKHAVDFVLFEIAPYFDCRMLGWPLLPQTLQDAVNAEQSRRKQIEYIGENNPNFGNSKLKGIPRTADVVAKIRANADRRPKSAQHRQRISETKTGKAMAPQAPNNPNRISGAHKGWETRRKNKN